MNVVLLRLPERHPIGTTLIIWIAELDAVVFPKTDVANVIRAGWVFVKCLIAAQQGHVYVIEYHLTFQYSARRVQKNGRHEVDRFQLTTTWTIASKSPIRLA